MCRLRDLRGGVGREERVIVGRGRKCTCFEMVKS